MLIVEVWFDDYGIKEPHARLLVENGKLEVLLDKLNAVNVNRTWRIVVSTPDSLVETLAFMDDLDSEIDHVDEDEDEGVSDGQ